MNGDKATLDFYENEAPVYTASGSQGQSKHMEGFLKLLDAGALILELGCGGGRDTAYMAERGFIVDATDGTAAMVTKARQRTGLSCRQMRFDELAAEAEYDAVWAHASLLHVPRSELGEVLERIHRALKPGGWFFANFKAGSADGRDILGRYYNFPDKDWLDSTYRKAGSWASLEIEEGAGGGYDGVQRIWLALTARKDFA
ncbi:class I SAM-dependent methyltransferase [Altererythrobacter sp. MF3-039]|uniref:class I SAM-dependent methyltransferase n=1 Tax=Altererythrobacter sp. MF3-039 TaxID=3252901 RepID=UPI00390C64AC